MSIIKQPEGSKDEKLFALRKDLTKNSMKLYNRIKNTHSYMFRSVWNNMELTPQEILDEYGSDAKELFLFSEQIQTMLVQINGLFDEETNPEGYQLLETPNEYTINPDGTVTVGAVKVTE